MQIENQTAQTPTNHEQSKHFPTQTQLLQALSSPEEQFLQTLSQENPYKTYPFLVKYREILGELNPLTDIFGIGGNGIIIKSPKTNSVFKVPLKKEVEDRLRNEYKWHNRILLTITKGKQEGLIQESIKVPKIFEKPRSDQGFLLEMEFINGKSFKSIALRRHFKEKLKQFNKERLDNLPDYQLEKLLRHIGISNQTIREIGSQLFGDVLPTFIPNKINFIYDTLEYLKGRGIEHPDLHIGNIMLANTGEIYIIDFEEIIFYGLKIN